MHWYILENNLVTGRNLKYYSDTDGCRLCHCLKLRGCIVKFFCQIIFLILIVLITSCADKSIESFSDEKLDEKIKDTSEKINLLISDVSCDSLSQCNVIKYGHKPCGGPMTYKIFSSKNTNEEEIEQLSEYYFDLTQEYNERHNIPSDCLFVDPPALVCDIKCKTTE